MATFGKRNRDEYERDYEEEWILDDADEGLDATHGLVTSNDPCLPQFDAFDATDFGGESFVHAPHSQDETALVCDSIRESLA